MSEQKDLPYPTYGNQNGLPAPPEIPVITNQPQNGPGINPLPGQINNAYLPQGNATNSTPGVAQTPLPMQNVPLGLEYLTQIDQLLIKQQIELLEVISGCETRNKYKVNNSVGQLVFDAKEDSGCCSRQCCGPNRTFNMVLSDNTGRRVIECHRPLSCASLCFCGSKMEVRSPLTNEIFGYCKQVFSCTKSRMDIYDSNNQKIFEISGIICGINCCNDVDFKVKDLNGNSVGLIQKQWSGCCQEAISDADNFMVRFPIDLDSRLKAVLVGAVFLIDFLYYEQPANKDQNNHGH